MKNTLLAIIFAFSLASCGEASTASSVEAKEMSAEQMLAIIDNINDTTDIKAVRIKTLVHKLAERYSEPKDTIAEYTSRAQSVLRQDGIEESCLNILEEMNKAGEIQNTKYSDAITFYLMMRTN